MSARESDLEIIQKERAAFVKGFRLGHTTSNSTKSDKYAENIAISECPDPPREVTLHDGARYKHEFGLFWWWYGGDGVWKEAERDINGYTPADILLLASLLDPQG